MHSNPYNAFWFRFSNWLSPCWSAAKWQHKKSIEVLSPRPNTSRDRGQRTRTPPLLLALVTTRFFPRAIVLVDNEAVGMSPHWIRSIRINTWNEDGTMFLPPSQWNREIPLLFVYFLFSLYSTWNRFQSHHKLAFPIQGVLELRLILASTHAFLNTNCNNIKWIWDPFFQIVWRITFSHIPGSCPNVQRLWVRKIQGTNKCLLIISLDSGHATLNRFLLKFLKH